MSSVAAFILRDQTPTPSAQTSLSPTPSASSTVTSSELSELPSPSSPSLLLASPSEILHHVLVSSATEDLPSLACIAKTCRSLRSFVYSCPDDALWRDIFLQKWDDPRIACAFSEDRTQFNWKKMVQDRESIRRLQTYTETWLEDLDENLDLIADTLLQMYLDLPGISPDSPARGSSRNVDFLSEFLTSEAFRLVMLHLSSREIPSTLRQLRHQPGNPNRRPQRQARNSKLNRLATLVTPDLEETSADDRNYRGRMREIVYNASNFHEGNEWGPFHSDGTVDWVLVDALSCVMTNNAKDIAVEADGGWWRADLPFYDGLASMRGLGLRELSRPAHLGENDVWDWAGVEGEWCGSYAFLDYADWMALNEPRVLTMRRSIHELDLSGYHEAVGDLMKLKLELDKPGDRPKDLPLIETNLPTSPLLPKLTFHGTSISGSHVGVPGSPNFVRGNVQLTADDPPQVRWTLVIRYGGEDKWRMECVQPGGRGSKRGFFGTWTDAAKELHSPNGPVMYWAA